MSLQKLLILVAVVALCGWWLFRSPGKPNYAITNEHPAGNKVLAFGDSLTAGKGASRSEAYPAVLAERLNISVLNKGISGDTTRDGLRRLDRDVLAQRPSIVLLGLGSNDFMQKKNIDMTFNNSRQMIQAIQQTGALVIMLSVEFPLGGSYARRYRELAEEMGCPHVTDLLDGIIGRPELMSDAVHPNARGYQKMADKIEPVLRGYLRVEVGE